MERAGVVILPHPDLAADVGHGLHDVVDRLVVARVDLQRLAEMVGDANVVLS